MGIFKVNKKNLQGEIVDSFEFQNTILDAGLEYLCNAVGNDFNKAPAIGVGSSDVTPDTNQVNLISPILSKTATYLPGTSTPDNLQGDKTFSVNTNFLANEAVGDLTEIAYYMNTGVPLNRTLFQTQGQLDTRFSTSPELDQVQNSDISNLTKVYGSIILDQTFTVASSAGGGGTGVTNLTEIALSFASSGNPPVGLTVALYSDNAGQPGSVLGTTTIAAFSEPVQRWRVAEFASPIAVTAGSVYHIVISAPGTDAGDSYDLFGSNADQYTAGQLLESTDGGTSYAVVTPSQDLGFKTYYTTSGATAHVYAVTMVQFDKETAMSATYPVSAFPENNLDSNSTSEGTVRLTLPTFDQLPTFVQSLNVYKNVGGTYELLANVGTTRQYFYDNGTITPNASSTPPSASAISAPTGLAGITDNTNGGLIQLGQNKSYEISAMLMGPSITQQSVGPYVHPGVSGTQFYDSAYNTIPTPLLNTEYETAASGELTVNGPSSNLASFTEYFTGQSLDSSKWNITNGNSDYFSLVTPASTNESQLQLNVPGGVPFVISSTRQARPGQSYYMNVAIPFVSAPKPFNVYDSGGHASINPIYTDSAPNRIPIFSFLNPANVQTQSSDKRLTFEVGMYRGYRTEDMVTQGDTSQYSHGPMFCLYDNVGNNYFFSTTDIQPSHTDGSYTFKVDINSDRTMQISVLNATTHTFSKITSTVGEFDFLNQFNGSHTTQGGQPGPATQATHHFLVPETYNFAIGNPSNDPLSYVNAQYIAVNDSIYTIAGTSPTVPVPAIAMTVNGSVVTGNGGYSTTLTWNAVPGARKYKIYATATPGSYNAANGNLVAEYDTYYPCYAVQSTETPNNDFQSGLVAVSGTQRNWNDIGVTYGIDSTTTGDLNGYALGGFVGSTAANYGNPLVPTIAQAPGSAEGYLLLLTTPQQKALFTFVGGGFELRAETGPDRGIGALYVDGNFVENIDFYSGNRLEQQSVYKTTVLTPGFHTVTIQPTGTANDFSLNTGLALDYFHVTVPAFVDTNTLTIGAPLSTNQTGIAAVPPPSVKGSKTYNGNGPTVVVKDPQHTLEVNMTFSLINPNL